MLHLKDGNYMKRNNKSHAHSNWQPLPPFLSFLPSKLACRQAGQIFVLYSAKLVLYMIEGCRVILHSYENVLQIYIPATFIVLTSFTNFWLSRAAVPARVSLGVGTVLTMTTFMSSSAYKLPNTSYPKVYR